jgi:hypothetical protein
MVNDRARMTGVLNTVAMAPVRAGMGFVWSVVRSERERL